METELFNSLKLEKNDVKLIRQLFDRIGFSRKINPLIRFKKVLKSGESHV